LNEAKNNNKDGQRILLFNRYDSNIIVRDRGLRRYINLTPVILPRTAGKHNNKRFGKSKMHIVERLITKVGITGHRGKKHKRSSGKNVGKYSLATKIVKEAMQIIEEKTKKNPIEVIVRAIENSAPMQETTVIEYGGARHPKCVDVSPQRRVDLALRWITQSSYQACGGKKLSFVRALANELILASEGDQKSAAVNKRIEVERQAKASR